MANDKQSLSERSQRALEREQQKQKILREKADYEKEQTTTKQPDDWSIL